VSPVRYELGFYIQEDDILHSHSINWLKIFKPALHEKVVNVGY
jgi:hypothetical protein